MSRFEIIEMPLYFVSVPFDTVSKDILLDLLINLALQNITSTPAKTHHYTLHQQRG